MNVSRDSIGNIVPLNEDNRSGSLSNTTYSEDSQFVKETASERDFLKLNRY